MLALSASCTGTTTPDARPAPRASAEPGGTLVFGVIGEPRTFKPGSPFASDLTAALTEPLGPFRVSQRTPGLEVVYEPNPRWDGDEPRLAKLVVRFVQTLDIAVELLDRGELDAAALPATVNLVDRVTARGLDVASGLGDEIVHLDMRGAPFDAPVRSALWKLADVPSLEEAFVRDLGRPVRTLHPGSNAAAGAGGPFESSAADASLAAGETITLGAPVGDELLALFQRALHDDWERAGIAVDVVTIDARTFYGEWEAEPNVDVALRRGEASGLPRDAAALRDLTFAPLFQMSSVVAWRDGVHGIEPNAGPGGPLVDAGRWWIDG